MNTFFQILKGVKSEREYREIFDITFTESERHMIEERWKIFQSISKGLSQRQVALETGASIATVTRGAKVFRQKQKKIIRLLERIK